MSYVALKPREMFQKTADSKEHLELVQKPSFQNAIHAALAEMQMRQIAPSTPSQSWDAGVKMEGAKVFISILLNLAEPTEERKQLPRKNLDHSV